VIDRIIAWSLGNRLLVLGLSAIFLAAGIWVAVRMPVDVLPDLTAPTVTILVEGQGMAPTDMEALVTFPIETALNGAAGVRSELPDDVEEPVVAKRDADASPILWLALSGADYDQVEISTIAETSIQDRLSKLTGVSEVLIAGERRFAMRVWIDNNRLTAQRLTVADVAAALARENVDLPSGRVESLDTEFTVRTLGELTTAEEYGDLIVADVAGEAIHLRDVADVEVGPEDERKLVRFNGKPAVGLGIVKQSNANTLDVAAAVKREEARIQAVLPAGLDL
jgi:multidrug efflux pump subunit AcrB